VPTQIVSSDEYLPVPQTAQQREVEARLIDMSDRLAKRRGCRAGASSRPPRAWRRRLSR
jgi:predicted secreted protein